MYSCNKTWHWVERTYKATVISSRLCHSSVVQLYYLLRLWLCVLRLLGSLRTSKTCLRHRRLLKRTTNVQSWKIFTSIKTLLPLHRSLRSLKLPPQLMFWFSSCYCVSGLIHFRHRVMRFTANEITWYKFPPCPFFYSALRASVALRATFRAPGRIWLAVIDFQNGEQQSRSGSDKKKIPLG